MRLERGNMRVLVTGGAGYIGSHAARALALRGHKVVLYDNLSTGHRSLAANMELVVGDVGDPARLREALSRTDAVMHFAAYASVGESVQNPRKYFENNARSGLALLNAMLDAGVGYFVFSSTCAVYGIPGKVPIPEDTPRLPVNPYGASKLFLEHVLEAYGQAHGLHFAALRYFNAAGADESGEIGELHSPETHLIPSALEAVSGLRPELQVYGNDYPTPDGTCVRDYIHVNDLAEAHVAALEYLAEGGPSVALNLGTGQGHSIREVINTVERVTGQKVPQRVSPRRPGDPPTLVADATRAQRVLRWKPSRSLEHIVETAWRWMQSCLQKSEAATPLGTRP